MFKGSGFYETDYRSDSYKKGAEAAKGKPETKDAKSKAGENSKGKGTSSSETKPSTKAEAKSSKPKNKSDD